MTTNRKGSVGSFMYRMAAMMGIIASVNKYSGGVPHGGNSMSKYAQLNPIYHPKRRKLKGYQKQGLRSFNKNK
jgi:hypothetical protein